MVQPSVAVFGCGHWGKHLVRNVDALGVLHSVVEPSPAGLAAAKQLAPKAALYRTPEEALAEPDVAAVMIATPAETHYRLARAALEAGKDVFVEKPLTVDVWEARDLVARARQRDRILMVGHLLEFHPAILKVREMAERGELGSLRYIVSNRLNLGKIRTEENALWSFAPHDIAVVLRLVGERPFEVVATGGAYISPNVADVTITQLLFNNGVRAHIFVSWLHPFKEQKLVVIGSKRMVTFDDVDKKLWMWDLEVDWQEGQPIPKKHEGIPVAYGDEEPLRQECVHFLECVEKREQPRTDGESGVAVLELLHAAQRSMMTNGAPVPISASSPSRAALDPSPHAMI